MAMSGLNGARKVMMWVRHGHSEINATAEAALAAGSRLKVDQETDCPLTETGRWQAESLKRQLVIEQQRGALPEVELVVSSPLRRAAETAELLFPQEEVQFLECLRELSFHPKTFGAKAVPSIAQQGFEWLLSRPEMTVVVVSTQLRIDSFSLSIQSATSGFCKPFWTLPRTADCNSQPS
ncbi:unnamed protein product [Durusdinium trenchii]|uniref:Phosphoglycerate mutase n=1 Tax=Durusdinium trenchii TaxID=1381693 RepID=A0ABP0Q4L2_9DINO